MLVQPQQAATVCELDLVQHTIGSLERAQTLDSNQRTENSYDPLNLTLDLEYAHVSSRFTAGTARMARRKARATSPSSSRSRFLVNTVTSQTGASMDRPTNQRNSIL